MTISACKRYALAPALALALILPLQAAAATEIVLAIDGVEGEAKLEGYEGNIEVLSWSWGASSPDGKLTCAQDLSLAKYTDSSTDDLVNALDTGSSFSDATLSLLRTSGSGKLPFHSIVLTGVRVTSHQSNGSGGEDRPIEFVSLSYREAKGTYRQMLEDGTQGEPQDYFISPDKCN